MFNITVLVSCRLECRIRMHDLYVFEACYEMVITNVYYSFEKLNPNTKITIQLLSLRTLVWTRYVPIYTISTHENVKQSYWTYVNIRLPF